MLFFEAFRRHVREFFSAILELEQKEQQEQEQQQQQDEKVANIREFFGAVLELARPSEAWCFPAGR